MSPLDDGVEAGRVYGQPELTAHLRASFHGSSCVIFLPNLLDQSIAATVADFLVPYLDTDPESLQDGDVQDRPDCSLQARGRYIFPCPAPLCTYCSLTSRIQKGPDSNTSESVGKIMDVLTEPGQQAGRNVNASPETPRYEVGCVESCLSSKYLRMDGPLDFFWGGRPVLTLMVQIQNLNTGKSTTIYEANILGISR